MRLTSRLGRALILLSAISILAVGCGNYFIPCSLKAGKTLLSLGEHTNIECVVSNSTGNINYKWASSDGSIQGEGASIDWLAPESAGDYFIRVEVEGENSKRGTAFITITVIENYAPGIKDLVITSGTKYLKKKGEGYLVGKDQTYYIECQALDEDNDDLIYTWSCDNGEMSGTGTKVTWKAPNANVKVNVTVTVSDGRNGVATQDLVLEVVACSACTFK